MGPVGSLGPATSQHRWLMTPPVIPSPRRPGRRRRPKDHGRRSPKRPPAASLSPGSDRGRRGARARRAGPAAVLLAVPRRRPGRGAAFEGDRRRIGSSVSVCFSTSENGRLRSGGQPASQLSASSLARAGGMVQCDLVKKQTQTNSSCSSREGPPFPFSSPPSCAPSS